MNEQWHNAGLSPLRSIYYAYLHYFHREPEDVYELLKGYSFIVLTRG